jgi:gamma-hexachlorocyclohexane dehydrochlorinase
MTSIEERLARLEAAEELHNLTKEYCHGLDKRDLDRFLAVFAPDAVWALSEDARPAGHAAIGKTVTDGIWPAFSETHHWTTNHVIDWLGDVPHGTCDVTATVRDVSGQWLRASATYDDAYVYADGRWRISRREATVHFTEPLG